MNFTPRTISRLAVAGVLAASGAAIVPGIAGAAGNRACAGKTIEASAHGQTILGTGCNDTINIGPFSGVTVYAGGGDDTVRAGYNYSPNNNNHVYLEGGNDKLLNPNDAPIWVHGGDGNDLLEGHPGYDAFYGGSGTDSAQVTTGDFYDGIENYL